MHEYTGWQMVRANIPYVLMVGLGATLLALADVPRGWGLVEAGGLVLYGIVGSFWTMAFVCRYCAYYGRACPCGYGLVSARLWSNMG